MSNHVVNGNFVFRVKLYYYYYFTKKLYKIEIENFFSSPTYIHIPFCLRPSALTYHVSSPK